MKLTNFPTQRVNKRFRAIGHSHMRRVTIACSRTAICLIAVCVSISVVTPAAHASTGGTIIKAISRYIFKETGQEVSEQAVKQMTKQVGEELIERTAQKIVREGGEKSLVEVSELVAKHGPDVIRALDNVPEALPVLKLLDELPADEIGKTASRLAAGGSGKELATLGTKIGTTALRAEAKHPGVGLIFVRSLGKDGAELSLKLSSEQAVQIGRHVDDIAKLPATQRSQLLALISSNVDRFTAFVGRFVEKNPGKVLFTAAGTTLVLAESERFLGGDEVVMDKDGNPQVLSKPGLVDRAIKVIFDVLREPIQWSMYLLGVGLAAVLTIVSAMFGGLKFWKHLRKDRLEVETAGNSAAAQPITTRSVSSSVGLRSEDASDTV